MNERATEGRREAGCVCCGGAREPERALCDRCYVAEQIARADVNEEWKAIFLRMASENLYGVYQEEEDLGVSIPGFFFGPFYYLYKGMWVKACVYMPIWIIMLGFIAGTLGMVEFFFREGFTLKKLYAVVILGWLTLGAVYLNFIRFGSPWRHYYRLKIWGKQW